MVANPSPGAPVVRDVVVGRPVDVDDRDGCRRRAVAEHGRRVRPDRREGGGVAGQPVREQAAVGDAGRVDAPRVDGGGLFDGADHGLDEGDVVEPVLGGYAAAVPADVPGPVDAVRVGDEEVPGVGLLVPAVGLFGLLGGAEAAVQHDDERGRVTPVEGGRAVQAETAILAVDPDGVGGRAGRSRASGPARPAPGRHGQDDARQGQWRPPPTATSHAPMMAGRCSSDVSGPSALPLLRGTSGQNRGFDHSFPEVVATGVRGWTRSGAAGRARRRTRRRAAQVALGDLGDHRVVGVADVADRRLPGLADQLVRVQLVQPGQRRRPR